MILQSKGSFTLTAEVCGFCSRLHQHRDRNFSIFPQHATIHCGIRRLLQLVWMSLKLVFFDLAYVCAWSMSIERATLKVTWTNLTVSDVLLQDSYKARSSTCGPSLTPGRGSNTGCSCSRRGSLARPRPSSRTRLPWHSKASTLIGEKNTN